MTKNKLIKCLKIIAVLGPLVFNLIVSLIGFAGSNEILNVELTPDINVININERIDGIMLNFIEITAENCFSPYIGVVIFNQNGTIPILYPIADFISNALVGVSIQEALNTFNVIFYSLIGFLCMFLYYLMIEIVFFIPEVILLFIRWCKNLIYSFTKKGGFDV